MFWYLLDNLDLLIPMLFLLGAAAFFACSETVLFSLTRHELNQLRTSGRRLNIIAADLRDQGRLLLVVVLLANMICTIGIFVLSTIILRRIGQDYGPLGATVGAAVPVLIVAYFGEVLPKMTGRRFNRALAPVIAGPISVVMRIGGPIAGVVQRAVIDPFHRVLSGHSASRNLNIDEVGELLRLSQRESGAHISEAQLLENVIRLHDVKVRQVMVPRLKMITFDISRPMSQLAGLFRQTHLTKIPVYEGNTDNILGVIYAKAFLLESPNGEREARPLVRPVLFVPEMMRLDRLLRIFREEHRQLAIVVDEFGGIAGLISLEDVVEQLIGEIYEPGDVNAPAIEETGPGEWLIPGDLTIRDYPELFGQRTRQNRSATPAGLIYSELHRLPQVGDRVQIGNVELVVESMRQGRVARVRVRIDAAAGRDGEDV